MDAYKKRFAYYAMDRANIIPACVAYLGCVGMSWGDCHETSRPRQDNKFEKWCKESVCLSSTFWESIFSQKRKGWIFQTSLRILYNCKSTFIIIYWDKQKRHVPVFSHNPGFDATLIWQPVPGGYQTASQRTPRTNVFPQQQPTSCSSMC